MMQTQDTEKFFEPPKRGTLARLWYDEGFEEGFQEGLKKARQDSLIAVTLLTLDLTREA